MMTMKMMLLRHRPPMEMGNGKWGTGNGNGNWERAGGSRRVRWEHVSALQHDGMGMQRWVCGWGLGTRPADAALCPSFREMFVLPISIRHPASPMPITVPFASRVGWSVCRSVCLSCYHSLLVLPWLSPRSIYRL
jgi:hypothetical protein